MVLHVAHLDSPPPHTPRLHPASRPRLTRNADWTLNECGLASLTLPILVGVLNNRYTKEHLHITVADMAGAESIMHIVKAIETSKAAAESRDLTH